MIWTTGEMNKWILELSKPETSLEAKMTKLKAVLVRAHHEKAGSLEKTIMLGKQKAAGKEEDRLGDGLTP